MGWLADYRCDVGHYCAISGRSSWHETVTQQGLWALFQYRVGSGVYHSRLPKPLKQPLLIGCSLWRKGVEIATGICLPREAVIGPGLYIGHFGGVVLHPHVALGANCNISQGVTIGVSGRGDSRGVPVIGERVYVAPHAVIAGKVIVGDGASISANSLVLCDVPAGALAQGVPAVVKQG